MDREEEKLRNHPGDFFTLTNLFENQVGHFWTIHETRNYMCARYNFVHTILKNFNNVDAVQVCLDHLMDLLRLSRSDDMGIRFHVPALFLRLGRDQECYDFVKWWATTGSESNYDWRDTDLPYLDLKDEDPFESLEDCSCMDHSSFLSHSVAVTLIKFRILKDLEMQQVLLALKGRLPQDVIDHVRRVDRNRLSSVVAARPDITSFTQEQLTELAQTVKGQIMTLYKAIDDDNPHFWSTLLAPEVAFTKRPTSVERGSKEEAYGVVQYHFTSWAETPGALDLMKELGRSSRQRQN